MALRYDDIIPGHIYRGRSGWDRLVLSANGRAGYGWVKYMRRQKHGWVGPRGCSQDAFSAWAVEDLGEHSSAEDAARG